MKAEARAAAAWERSRADAFEEYRRLLFDAGPADPAAAEEALRLLSAPRDAEGRARRGRVLAILGRGEEARRELTAASAAPDSARWLGALLLASGDAAAALRAFDRAPSGDAWASALAAAAGVAAGRDAAAALARCAKIEGEPGRFAALVEDLAATRAGRPSNGALDREVARGDAWALVVRSTLSAARGDTAARLRDLDEALRREPAAWLRDFRSRAFEELGDMHRALAEADAASELEPSVDRLLRRAEIQVCRRYYHLAAPLFEEAARRDPRRLEAWLGAASVALTRGDARKAAELAARAAKKRPDSEWARFESLRYEAYARGGRATAARLRALARSAPDRAFDARMAAGVGALRDGKPAAAAREFAAAADRAPSPHDRRKAGFHRALALGLVLPARKPRRAGRREKRLLIAGLGGAPPYTATLGALRFVAACDRAFNNLSEPEIAALIAALAEESEPTMFDARGADRRWTRTIFRRVRPGRTVGFITRGHPLVCGGLAAQLMVECGRVGASWDILPAVSSMDALAVRAAPGKELWSQQVFDWSAAYDDGFRLETRSPAVMYFNAAVQTVTAEQFALFCAKLEAVYSPDHEALFYGRTFAAAPEKVRLSEVRSWYGRIDPSYTLVLPPKREP